jgi:tripartite-type tricarboxylate transporter receptor subunit TctC
MGSELMNVMCKAVVTVVICVSAVTVVFLSTAPALAQTYPTQRVQILVPFSAGTALDSLARVTADRFSAEFGQPVVVINRPGASGTIAFGEVAAAHDGHTLMFAGQTQLTVQPYVKTDLPYRVEDIEPVCQMFETPFALVVGPNSPLKSFADLAAAARANPDTIRFGHSGPATSPHILGMLLARTAGFRMADIPYRALGDQVKDVIGGTIDAAILSIGSFSPASVRAITVFNRKRSATFPEVPTVAELGYALPFRSINGLFAPRSLPAAVSAQLKGACARAFASEEFSKAAERLNVNAELVVGGDFAKRLDDERREMKTLIETLGLKER